MIELTEQEEAEEIRLYIEKHPLPKWPKEMLVDGTDGTVNLSECLGWCYGPYYKERMRERKRKSAKDPSNPRVIIHKRRNKENVDIKRHPGYTYNVPGAEKPIFRVWDYEQRKTRYLSKVPLTNWDRKAFDDPKEMKPHCGWMPALTKVTNWDWKRQVLIVASRPLVVLDIDRKYEEVCEAIKSWKWAADKPVLVTPSFSGNAHVFIRMDMSSVIDGLILSRDGKPLANAKEWPQYFHHTLRYIALQEFRRRISISFSDDTGIEVDQVCLRNETLAYRPDEIARVNEFFKSATPVPMLINSLPNSPVGLVIEEAIQTEAPPDFRIEKLNGFISEFRRFLDKKDSSLSEIAPYVTQFLGVKPGKAEYYEKAIEIMRLNYDSIVRHWCTNIDVLWPMRAKKTEIGLAKADFNQKYLGLPTAKYSTYFRQIFCYMASLGLETFYIQGKKTNDYRALNISDKLFFSEEILRAGWRGYRGSSEYSGITAQNLSKLLGNGKTFSVLTKCIVPIMMQYGQKNALELIERAIYDSEANDKDSRVKFVEAKMKWLVKNHKVSENSSVSKRRQEDQGICGEGAGECDLPCRRFQHNQCSIGEGSGAEGVRQSVRRSVLQTCVDGDDQTQENGEIVGTCQPFFKQTEVFGLGNPHLSEGVLQLQPRAPPSS